MKKEKAPKVKVKTSLAQKKENRSGWMFISPYLAAVTLKFTPVEYFSIAIFSLTIIEAQRRC